MDDNRKKALSAALGQIEKQFGKGSVMRLGDAAASYDVEAISTGSLGLDIALQQGPPLWAVHQHGAALTHPPAPASAIVHADFGFQQASVRQGVGCHRREVQAGRGRDALQRGELFHHGRQR